MPSEGCCNSRPEARKTSVLKIYKCYILIITTTSGGKQGSTKTYLMCPEIIVDVNNCRFCYIEQAHTSKGPSINYLIRPRYTIKLQGSTVQQKRKFTASMATKGCTLQQEECVRCLLLQPLYKAHMPLEGRRMAEREPASSGNPMFNKFFMYQGENIIAQAMRI